MRQTLLFYNLNSIFMKKIYLFAALAAMLAACSENDLTKDTAVQQNAEEGAVQFGAYVNRGTTRAGWAGTLTTSTGANNLQTEGFGVFGYYTNDELYSQNAKPEFFYNQKVAYDDGWKYTPIKYWPNEFGATAESQAEDKLTFFAYAPYVNVNINTGIAQPSTGEELETGIISLTRNTALGDPYVKYCASFDPEKCVDLCFGVAKENFRSSVDGDENRVDAGTPYIDVKKPKLSDRIYFDFKHALAQLNVQIDADVEVMSHNTESYLDGATKIYVREVTFEGFADKGMLNLNSEAKTADYTPKWVDLSGINEIKSGKVTIYDGRRDGREGQVNASASNEKPQNLNPEIISNEGNGKPGVPADKLVNLFAGEANNSPILVIPTGENLSVTIVYDVETKDDNLASFLSDGKTHGSSVENKITKEIKIGTENLILAAGKSYVVKLHLGMTSVKFEASVTDWQIPVVETDADLPVNAPSYAAALGGDPVDATVPYSITTGIFQVTGLAAGSTDNAFTGAISGTVAATSTIAATDGGILNLSYTINANNKPKNLSGTLTVTQSATDATLNIIQQACPLGLEATGISDNSSDECVNIELTAQTATGMVDADWSSATIIVSRDRNGVKKNLTTSDFSVSPSGHNGTLVLTSANKMLPGDVYTITVTAGDAAPETVTFTVGGIMYLSPLSVEYGVDDFCPAPLCYGKQFSAYASGCGPTSSGTYANVLGDDNPTIVTIKAGGPEVITVVVSQDDIAGYWSSDATKTATYNLTVEKTNGTISYENKTITGTVETAIGAVNSGDPHIPVLMNSKGNPLTIGADKGGAVSYTIQKVMEGSEEISTATFSMTDGVLSKVSALAASKTYVVTVRATVSNNDNASYDKNWDEATITFTTANP